MAGDLFRRGFYHGSHSGETIFSVNGDLPLPPASTGKIVTVLLTLDVVEDLSETPPSARAPRREEMSLYLQKGEVLSIEDLLKGALVHSGNDACYAIGEAVAGSESLFVHWLNMKAAAMGAYSASLKTPTACPPKDTKFPPRIWLFSPPAATNIVFSETVARKYISLGEGKSYRYYQNTNKLLWQDSHIVGGKNRYHRRGRPLFGGCLPGWRGALSQRGLQ